MILVDRVFNDVVTPYLEPRLKKQSLKAVKSYVKAVAVARKIAITAYGIGAASAILVAGIVLVVVAIVGLLPIDPRMALIAMLIVGLALSGLAGFVAYTGLSERNWLEMSKSNELMEAAIKPWPTAYSIPDPRSVLFRSDAEKSFEKNRELSRGDRMPARGANDELVDRVPPATFASLDTPESALVSGSIDTTSHLRAPEKFSD